MAARKREGYVNKPAGALGGSEISGRGADDELGSWISSDLSLSPGEHKQRDL